MNSRKDRWDDRDHLKRDSNRHGNLDAAHPQARRGIESQLDQESDLAAQALSNPTGSGNTTLPLPIQPSNKLTEEEAQPHE